MITLYLPACLHVISVLCFCGASLWRSNKKFINYNSTLSQKVSCKANERHEKVIGFEITIELLCTHTMIVYLRIAISWNDRTKFLVPLNCHFLVAARILIITHMYIFCATLCMTSTCSFFSIPFISFIGNHTLLVNNFLYYKMIFYLTLFFLCMKIDLFFIVEENLCLTFPLPFSQSYSCVLFVTRSKAIVFFGKSLRSAV